MSTRGVLDTSVFIAAESGRSLNEELLPEESAISVITLAELQAGVLAAKDTQDTQGDIEKAPMLPVREMDSWEEQAATLDPFDSAAIDAVLIDNPTRSVGRPAVRLLTRLADRVHTRVLQYLMDVGLEIRHGLVRQVFQVFQLNGYAYDDD